MKIQLHVNTLAACLVIAAKKDVRYYLNGVNISDKGYTATDGHRLISIPHQDAVTGLPDNGVTIPRDTIEQIFKYCGAAALRRVKYFELEFREGFSKGSIHALGAGFDVDFDKAGTYPDFERVFPGDYDATLQEGGVCRFNWDYMADFAKAAEKYTGKKAGFCPEIDLKPNGPGGASVIIHCISGCRAVIMPMRVK